ncbi:MAG: O-antigen ligase family protein [Anaerolineae bacterium]
MASMVGQLPVTARLDSFLGFSNMWLVMAMALTLAMLRDISVGRRLVGRVPIEDMLLLGYLVTGIIVTATAGRLDDALARLTSELLSICVMVVIFRKAFRQAGADRSDLLRRILIPPTVFQAVLCSISLLAGVLAPDVATSEVGFYLGAIRLQRLLGVYGNPNTLGMMSLVGLLCLAISFPPRSQLYMRLVLGIPMVACIILSQSRACFISLSVIMISAMRTGSVPLLLFAVLLSGNLMTKVTDFIVSYLTSRDGVSDLLSTRLNGWTSSIFTSIRMNPSGYGWRLDVASASQVESFYFAILLQTGIIGAFFLFSWICVKLATCLSIISREIAQKDVRGLFDYRVMVVIIALLVHGVAESPLAAGSSAARQILFLCIAYCDGWPRWIGQSYRDLPERR